MVMLRVNGLVEGGGGVGWGEVKGVVGGEKGGVCLSS